MQANDIQKQLEAAYFIVQKTGIAEESIQLHAFKYALSMGAGGGPMTTPNSGQAPENNKNSNSQTGLVGIANALGVPYDIIELFFDIADGELTLNLPPKVLPDSASAAMREIGILLAVGRKHASIGATTSFDLIRLVCDENGKLDRKNFAAAMSQMKPKLVPSGKGTNKELVPKRPADDLAKELILKYNEIAR